MAEIEAVLRRIEQGPDQCRRTRGEARVALSHRFPYAVHFLPDGADIIVLAVLHQRRSSLVHERLED